jgi:two-component system sensor histidine kinase LytS
VEAEAIARAERAALALAADLLPALSEGLTENAADRICTALLAGLDLEAVAVNGPDRIISSWGDGMEHHPPGGSYRTNLDGRAIARREPAVARTSRQVGCAVVDCPITSGVAAPIIVDGDVVGLLSGWRTGRRPLSRPTIEAITGLAALFAARLHGPAPAAATEQPQPLRSAASLRSDR